MSKTPWPPTSALRGENDDQDPHKGEEFAGNLQDIYGGDRTKAWQRYHERKEYYARIAEQALEAWERMQQETPPPEEMARRLREKRNEKREDDD